MPCGDQTGPMGQGPETGRAAGKCAGYGVPGYMNPVPGRGFGRGRGSGRGGGRGHGWGRGRGWRHRGGAWGSVDPSAEPFTPALTPEQEIEVLKRQAEYFNKAHDNIRKRIRELERPEAAQNE